MNLKARLNLALGACALIAVLAAALVMHHQLRERALAEVQREAELHMEAATALRSYTGDHVRPLLNTDPAHFQQAAVPSFAATTAMRLLHERYPGVSYREVALNPTNPANRATGVHEEIVRTLREGHADTLQRFTSEGGREMLYVAKPLHVAEANCLACHGRPQDAPPAMLAVYGAQGGFGWKMGETVGAQVVAVPLTLPLQRAGQALGQFLAVAVAVVLAVFLALNAMLRKVLLNPIASRQGELQRQAMEDALTGAINRRGLHEFAEAALGHARAEGGALSIVLFDIDHFKQVNDRFGHAAGDAVLRELVRRIHARIRADDLLGRLGGDEFALVLPQATLHQAHQVATQLHATLQGELYPHGQPVGFSMGLAQWDGHEDLASLFARADKALYAAKEAGRGRVSS
ncbi:MAG: diguanylate cyclase [Vitreoscilla sp.]|nr:diguanylate cyclase [Vitreoscilla sp.]